MYVFKVWDSSRTKKGLISILPSAVSPEPVLPQLILKASQKLEISDGHTLVLEKDGTPIDEDDILIYLRDETIILLSRNEKWKPDGTTTPNESSIGITPSTSFASTVTIDERSETVKSVPPQFDISQLTAISDIPVITLDGNLDVLWKNFDVQWEKLPQTILESCQQGKREKRVIAEVVHFVINEMRAIKFNLPAKALKLMANKIVSRFPDTFQDVDEDGVILGDGSCSLYCKLYERSTYLNRPFKRKLDPNRTTPPQKTKQRNNAIAGCSLQVDTASNNTESNFEHQSQLNEYFTSEKRVDEKFFGLMESTFASQRTFIESQPTVEDITANWPIIFKKEAVQWHFKKICKVNLTTLSTLLKERSEKIINFGAHNEHQTTANQDNNCIAALTILATYFKEDINKFIFKFESEDTIDYDQLHLQPCLVEIDDGASNQWLVFLEKKPVGKYDTFFDCLEVTFALYYILNLVYPKEISLLLEMVQRYFLKIHPDFGSKSKKPQRKIITLIKKLN